MTKEEALAAIKTLRDKINDTPDPASNPWINPVLTALDEAIDLLF